jgi:hypothetical protein
MVSHVAIFYQELALTKCIAQAKVKQVGWEVVLEGVKNRSILLKIM